MAFQAVPSVVTSSALPLQLSSSSSNCEVSTRTTGARSLVQRSSLTIKVPRKFQLDRTSKRQDFEAFPRQFVGVSADRQLKEEWYDQGIFDVSRWPNNLVTDAFYGFGKNAETFNGRAAMVGLGLGLATEVLTGKGIFEQLGITNVTDEYSLLRVLVGTWLVTIVGYLAYAGNRSRIDAVLGTDEEDLQGGSPA